MNIEQQLLYVREKRRADYLKSKGIITDTKSSNTIHSRINIITDENINVNSIRKIQKIVREKILISCLNEDELKYIDPIHRIRITFTNNHERIYSEENIGLDILFMTRLIHNLNNINPKNIFSYCFDIRDIYHVRNKPIIISNNKYYFQPDDHVRIINRWCRINNPNLVKYIR